MTPLPRVSTGISGLDEIINFLRMGDNVVLQVDDIADYKRFVDPYVAAALARGQRIVYMRFAAHAPLFDADRRIKTYKLNSASGFELFSTQVHNIIKQEGRDVFYVFDCLSDLILYWATDLMIDNFFCFLQNANSSFYNLLDIIFRNILNFPEWIKSWYNQVPKWRGD